MSEAVAPPIHLLDCTLRDGGYYTQWHFDDALVRAYCDAMNRLPVSVVEVGYRVASPPAGAGDYAWLPEERLAWLHAQLPGKALAVMMDVKNTALPDLERLLAPCIDRVQWVRLSVAPQRLAEALALAAAVRAAGFSVALNLMYASTWWEAPPVVAHLAALANSVDRLNVVDSYGGLYPAQTASVVRLLRQLLERTPIGFHGHHNLELAFANSLAALEAGADTVDTTVMGMGRGAGNLKLELLLTHLQQAAPALRVDFLALNALVAAFTPLWERHRWGTAIPYMLSGAASLPQQAVMDQLAGSPPSLETMNALVETLQATGAGRQTRP